MRGAADVPVGTSLREALPPVFADGGLVGALVDGLDAVLAPVPGTLDDLDAYLDPRYAPDDFARWLGQWLGAPVDARWPADRVRRHLPDLLTALLGQGTLTGLTALVRAVTGNEPEVTDSGGVAWSPRQQGELPGLATPGVRVRVVIARDDPETMEDVLRQVVAAQVPAHVPAVVETERG